MNQVELIHLELMLIVTDQTGVFMGHARHRLDLFGIAASRTGALEAFQGVNCTQRHYYANHHQQ